MIVYRLAAVGHDTHDSFIGDYVASIVQINAMLSGEELSDTALFGVRLEFVRGRNSPDLLDCPITCLVVSMAFRSYIEEWMGENVQFFPAPLFERASGAPVPGYWICNVGNVIDCVDWNRSQYERDEKGHIRLIRELYLSGKKVAGHAMFRPKDVERRIFVSPDFARGLTGRGLRGIVFSAHRYIAD